MLFQTEETMTCSWIKIHKILGIFIEKPVYGVLKADGRFYQTCTTVVN